MTTLTIILIILGVIILYIILAYNKLIRLKMRIDNAWSQIDVQLKRRYNLIPNLVKTVKAYVKHERKTFENVTKARSEMLNAKTIPKKAQAENMMSSALKSIFAIAENYPQLKANENFKMLQEELAGTESKIAYARQFYNDNVMALNTSVQTFPTKIIASLFNFKEREFFKAQGKEREVVQVDFE